MPKEPPPEWYIQKALRIALKKILLPECEDDPELKQALYILNNYHPTPFTQKQKQAIYDAIHTPEITKMLMEHVKRTILTNADFVKIIEKNMGCKNA